MRPGMIFLDEKLAKNPYTISIVLSFLLGFLVLRMNVMTMLTQQTIFMGIIYNTVQYY